MLRQNHQESPSAQARAHAFLAHFDQILALSMGERLINKVFARVMQSHAMGWLVVRHYRHLAGLEPPPTLAWLQERTAGGRTLAAFIGIARAVRLLEVRIDSRDRRQRILLPKTVIVDGLRGWLVSHFALGESLGHLPPGSAQTLRTQDAAFARYVCACGEVLNGIRDFHVRFPAWGWFEQRDCGSRIAFALLREHYRGQCLPDVHPDPAIPALGGRIAAWLGLSKSHVRNVINGAERLGALRQDSSHRQVHLEPTFVREVEDMFDALTALMGRAHHAAKEIASTPAAFDEMRQREERSVRCAESLRTLAGPSSPTPGP